MKSSSTIHLEEKFWNLIKNYQNDNKLSSRNDAIQLILTEWEILKRFNFKSVEPLEANNIVVDEPKIDVEVEVSDVDPLILNGLLDIKNTMKD